MNPILPREMIKNATAHLTNRSMVEGITEYILRGRPMGGFLTAVFENDLVLAASAADPQNIVLLHEYATMLYHVPSNCFGSREEVNAWIDRGGLLGHRQSDG